MLLAGGLILIGIPICAIVAIVMATGLKARVQLLEQRLAATEARLAAGWTASGTARETPAEPEADLQATTPAPEVEEILSPSPEGRQSVPAVALSPAEEPNGSEQPPSPLASPLPSSRRTIEEQLGTRWAVWIGGLALALGGIFLVRFSIEQGLLGPKARVTLGCLFALALAGAAEWMRRREIVLSLGGFPSAHIPSVLTAAGTLTAFGTAYSAYALYDLIGPASAFVLLGLISVLTIVAAILHGPALAGLGLAATLVSPLLVSSETPQIWPVVLYLAFVVAAADAVARLRLWRWLATTASAGAILWTGLLLMTVRGDAEIAPVMVHILVQTALAGAFLVFDPHRLVADEDARPDWWASTILLALALLTLIVIGAYWGSNLQPVFASAVALMMLGLALRFAPVAPAAAWSALIGIGTLALWPVAAQVAREPLSVFPNPFGRVPTPAALQAFSIFAFGAAVVTGAACLHRLSRGHRLPQPVAAWFAGAGVVGPLAILVIAYWRITAFDHSISFAVVAALLGLAFAGAVRWLMQQGEPSDAMRLGLGAAASGALAALALGLTFALDKGMLTVAFALMALGTAWVADKTALPALRHAVAAVGILVLGRLIWSPSIVGGSPGEWPVLNWLLWGYGVPAVSFWFAARRLERSGRDVVVRFIESLAICFAAFLVFFEIRHAIHGGIEAGRSSHLEAGLVTASTLLFALVLVRLDRRRPDVVYRTGTEIFSALSVLVAGYGLLVRFNPFLSWEPVLGGAVLNSLLPAYLLPAALAGLLALTARQVRTGSYVRGMAGFALLLHLTYTMLEVRRLFQGSSIHWELPTGEGEQWSYSLALLGYGLVILAIGILRDSRFLRFASVIYLGLAVLKVFIIDLSNLEGVMRALSFIGLGAALIGIALVYQRVLARRPEPMEPAAGTGLA
jgi:uncharacterized membrane protein